MCAAVYHDPEDIRVEDVPRPEVENPGDALIRVTHTAVCGSDLWPYRGQSDRDAPSRIGHEPMGIVEEVGDNVRSVEPGDRVFAPFVISCGACEFCRQGLHTSCVDGDGWGGDNGGAQGEYVRAPDADGTLVRIPDRYADELIVDVLGGTLDPSPILTKTVSLEDVADGYRAMDDREAIKVLVKP